ncbi:MAG TPA: DUF1549 domain-containing protein [Pirellulaceae bacterium]|nr:DUF1549 domain-containing protein [Pirellulaceae bacterium]
MLTSRISMWLLLVLASSVVSHAVAQVTDSSNADRRVPKISSSELANWIDEQFAAEWDARGVPIPPVVDDSTFMRRVYLDLVGTIPGVPRVRDFLYATGTYKREDLIDRLLRDDRRPERYASRSAEHLARIWRRAMIPQNSPNAAMAAGFEPWLRDQFGANVAYDEFARKLLTSTPTPNPMANQLGRTAIEPVQVFYQANGGTPVSSADAVTRYFLGVRIGCAQCHPHPFSTWKQEDFWGMAAFFSNATVDGQLPRISDEAGATYKAKFLWDKAISIPDDKSPRDALADWLVAPSNPNFASTAVNRIWQHLCGRGIVAAVDDLDQVTDEERAVLDELGKMFAESGYNMRWLIEGICKSKFYQRASLSQDAEVESEFALRPLKTLTPEQVFDSLEEALALPIGRIDNPPRFSGLRDAFVDRMDEAVGSSPEDFQAGIPQALMVMNGKLTADATSLAKSRTLRAVVDAPFLNAADKIETLFLAAFTRMPSEQELGFLLQHVESQSNEAARGRAYEEVFWGMLNSPEFVLSR